MNAEQIETRLAEIAAELDNPEADLTALENEVRSLNEQRDALKAQAAADAETRRQIAEGIAGATIEKHESEVKTMTNDEIRSSAEYVDAFAEYIKSGDDTECRALLTENVSGTVPVPVLVDDIIRHAWENDAILARVRKTNFRGNLKVAFERSADDAYVHTEGSTAPTEEALTLGIITMVPANIKKYVRISDEAAAMGGEALLRYVYEELTYKIMKKLSALVIGDIKGLDTSNGASAVGAKQITQAPGLTTVAEAYANLSDEATNCVVIMNKLTYANFKEVQAAANFSQDPFEGMPVLFSSALPAYDTATGGTDVYMIVGDLRGAQVNYPEGEGIILKYDDLTEMEKDMIRVCGRQYAAHAVTQPFAFTNVKKPSAATT